MNIFHLDKNPIKCAEYHCDKHVVKMILETSQMLSTAYQKYAGKNNSLYKSSYPNHPMTLWVGQNADNFAWTMIHGLELCKEYTLRYNKTHATEKIINDLYNVCKGNYMKKTEPPQCMPDKYKSKSYVQAYRNYYIGDKKRFARYTNRKPPEFMQ